MTCTKRSQGVLLAGLLGVCLLAGIQNSRGAEPGKDLSREEWWLHPDYTALRPAMIAVLPMVNMSLEPDVEKTLQQEVYQRIVAKGYQKTDAGHVQAVMLKLGIQTPEQLAGISYQKLGRELQCDAVIRGQVNQSAAQHGLLYDAIVVSCSLELTDCRSGHVLWRCEQFRTAHRQWQLDPFNMLLTTLVHEGADRTKRIAWLVQEMFRTLPTGPVIVSPDNFFERAQPVEISPSSEPTLEEK
ncbi:DUF799 family lipoprotein [bacterium]|nr:DUF799 family lipoprotein [bacterium]